MNRNEKLAEFKRFLESNAQNEHVNYTRNVRGILYLIKRETGLENNEIAYLLGIPVASVENILDSTWDGHISTKLATKLFLLSNGEFALPGCKMTRTMKEKIETYIHSLVEVESESDNNDEKVESPIDNLLLDVFGFLPFGCKTTNLKNIFETLVEKASEKKESQKSDEDKNGKNGIKLKFSIQDGDNSPAQTHEIDLSDISIGNLLNVFQKFMK